MISKRERNQIKKVLGLYYTEAVQEELHKKGSRNRYGLPHSGTSIRNVMNGREHKEIEAAIFAAVEKKTKELEREKQRREKILAQTKTGAVTPA
ncbi:MAG: hypothetical protein WBG90_05145 [Saonia sp.]